MNKLPKTKNMNKKYIRTRTQVVLVNEKMLAEAAKAQEEARRKAEAEAAKSKVA